MAIPQAPNIPHLGGPYVPSVSMANSQSRGKVRPREEDTSTEAPPQKAARQTADESERTEEPE
eukprot:10703747-Lingulodinium_polyedra.AAC.1